MANHRVFVVGLTVAALLAGCGGGSKAAHPPGSTTSVASSSTSSSTAPSTSTTTTVPIAPEGWRRLPDAPIWLGIYGVWTGHEYIGGTQGCCEDFDGTAVVAYSPAANRWRPLSPFPLPARIDEIAVWAGNEMVVVGGRQRAPGHLASSEAVPTATGAALDPATNRWHAIAPMPAAMSAPQGAVWTGHEVVVFDATHTFRYSPATNTWRVGAPPPIARDYATVVWTGREMLVWSGNRAPSGNTDSSAFTDVRADGAAYNPATNTWRAIPPAPVPARNLSAAVWTGREMIAWGGNTPGGYVGRGAAYNPTTNSWRALPLSPLKARVSHQMVWTGREVLAWGGQIKLTSSDPNSGYPHDGAAYNPATNTWRWLSAAPPSPPAMLSAQSAVWTGTAALFIGGAAQTMQGTGPLGLSYSPGR